MSDEESPSPKHMKAAAGGAEAESSHHAAKHLRSSPPHDHSRRHTGRRVLWTILLILLLVGITALVLYLVYRPSTVHFSVVSASVYGLNISGAAATTSSPPPAAVGTGADTISTSMQFTVLSRNPNERSSVRYDRLNAYLVYRGQPITSPTPLPPIRQDQKSAVAISPLMRGAGVPVHPDVAAALQQEATSGAVGLRLVMMGRIKYLPGPFRSAWYGMFVACDLMVGFRNGGYGQVPLLSAHDCHVDT